jgi:hypothetical protein
MAKDVAYCFNCLENSSWSGMSYNLFRLSKQPPGTPVHPDDLLAMDKSVITRYSTVELQ